MSKIKTDIQPTNAELEILQRSEERYKKELEKMTNERNGYKELLSESETAYRGLVDILRTIPEQIMNIDSFADDESYNFPVFGCEKQEHDAELNEWFVHFINGLGEYVNAIFEDALSGLGITSTDATEVAQ